MNIKEFSEKYTIGTSIRYYSIMGLKNFKETVIRSDPWALGNGEIVVKIGGVSGGVSIGHIKPAL